MLSSLPPELLHQIIESTVPHTFHTTTYDDRKRTLCSLSLVSKQFQAIAQPLLHKIVWIKSTHTYDRYKTTIDSFGEGGCEVDQRWRPQAVVIGGQNWPRLKEWSEEELSVDLPRMFSPVKSLTWDFGSVNLGRFPPLSTYSNLSSLHLSRISFEPGNVPKLPQLQKLTLSAVESSLLVSLLDPAVVPTLKHFSLVGISEDSVRQLKQSRLADLLPQLETLNLQLAIWRNPKFTFLHSAAERTLVDCYPYQCGQMKAEKAKVVHLRLMATYLENANVHQSWIDLVHRNLSSLISFIQSTPKLPLRNLYLDSSLKMSSTLPLTILKLLKELVEAGEERSIKIVYEIRPENLYLDCWISEEFIRRQRSREM